jgi:hypothetical protein
VLRVELAGIAEESRLPASLLDVGDQLIDLLVEKSDFMSGISDRGSM